MAKKSAVKINRSAAIKAYRAEHPKAKPAEVAAAVSKQLGIEIKAQYVSVVSMQEKKKSGKKSGKAVKARGGSTVGNGFAATMKAASVFIAAAGGIDAAIEALDAIAMMRTGANNN